ERPALAGALDRARVRAGLVAPPGEVGLQLAGPRVCVGLAVRTRPARGAPAGHHLDVEKAWNVDPQRFHSRSRNTPFAGWTLRGRVIRTYLEGKLVHRSEE